MAYELAIVGGGNMGAALLGGILSGGAPAAEIVVIEPNDTRRRALAECAMLELRQRVVVAQPLLQLRDLRRPRHRMR